MQAPPPLPWVMRIVHLHYPKRRKLTYIYNKENISNQNITKSTNNYRIIKLVDDDQASK